MTLRQAIIECSLCPRLRAHCQEIATKKRRAYLDQTYWGRPVPTFGVRNPELLVVGLAPGAHGANRTGRVFTGDSSGDWLYRALYEHGFASQPDSSGARDGLKLVRTAVNCVVRCAPPQNRPARDEIENCRAWLLEELAAYRRLKVIVALGRIAFDSFRKAWGREFQPKPRFVHDGVFSSGELTLLSSYHPSRQNTQTGRLTRPMFHRVFQRARRMLES